MSNKIAKAPLNIRIGPTVRYLRRDRNLTQIQLSRIMNKRDNYIYRLEHDLGSPTLRNLYTLGQALNVEVWRIIRLAEDRQVKQSIPLTKKDS